MSDFQTVSDEKRALRKHLIAMRDNMSLDRRLEGSLRCSAFLKEKLKNSASVISYASRDKEINIWDFNLTVCSWGKLILPRVEDSHLVLYRVNDIEKDMQRSSLNILEPNPEKCRKANIDEFDTIIVPALGYDNKNNRIGYGHGYYDRLLASLDEKLKIGVCFYEQILPKIPTSEDDIAVDVIYAF